MRELQPSAVLALQRRIGNRAVSRFLRGPLRRGPDEFVPVVPADIATIMPPADAGYRGEQVVAPNPQAALSDAAEELSVLNDERLRRRQH